MRLRVDRRTGEIVLTIPRRVAPPGARMGGGPSRLDRAAAAGGPGGGADRRRRSRAAARRAAPSHMVAGSGTRRHRPGRPASGRRPAGESRGAGGALAEAGWRSTCCRGDGRVRREGWSRSRRVGVGDPVSRWGSCSASGAIRYSWRLILAPDWVRRATVAHEVAHRVHMNHGPDFHALVERLLGGDRSRARLWLRRHGSGLHRLAPRG
jgi:hypothetical protein